MVLLNLEKQVAITLVIISLLITRLIIILPIFKPAFVAKDGNSIVSLNNKKKLKLLQVFIFLGSGGHTGEMLNIINNYKSILLNDDRSFEKIVIYLGYSDLRSLDKFKKLISNHNIDNNSNLQIEYLPFLKARNVNSSTFNSFITILNTIISSFKIILRIYIKMLFNNHNLVLLNGPGTCCIIVSWFKFFIFFTPFINNNINIIYIESLARITNLSLTGKILYLLVDNFIVQWNDLSYNYPRSTYMGLIAT